jgi:uncharacterized membrane protein YjfL (UPF0719 family)|tara:strand:+ start:1263 stop:1538 length:276 start_codon:yes stop_codon:yes gene_type:complete
MTKEKESVFDLNKEQIILYNDIYKLITPCIKPDNPDSLLMTSGTLLAIAVQLYTALYKNDETIEMILENAKESLPKLRDSIHKELHTLTLH